MKIFSSVPLDNRFGAGYIIVDADVNVNIKINISLPAQKRDKTLLRWQGKMFIVITK